MTRNEDIPTEIVGDRSDSMRTRRKLVAMWSGGALVRPLPDRGTITLGRGEAADVVIDHTSVSRRHAILTLGDEITVEDLGSANGTWVRGSKIAPNVPTAVKPDALFELGSVMCVVRGDQTTSPHSGRQSPDVVIADPEMERVFSHLELAAQSNLSILLLGETGVGKEVLAAHVHACSRRAEKPYLRVNCAALVESLLEAELFGYERGAFTGAVQAKPGILEAADGGTLFLDEVGEMPLATQAKLLRVLESGEVTRVGGLQPRAVDVRFVSATNRELRERIAHGSFRADLFFRLDGVSIHVPSLRERRAEIPALARFFLRHACVAHGRSPMTLGSDAEDALAAHPWPGNVRELRNVVSRSVVFARGSVLAASDLRFDGVGSGPSPAVPPPAASSSPRPASVPDVDRTDERARIEQALDECVGNQTKAAKLLGISRRTLVNRLDALGIRRPRKQV